MEWYMKCSKASDEGIMQGILGTVGPPIYSTEVIGYLLESSLFLHVDLCTLFPPWHCRSQSLDQDDSEILCGFIMSWRREFSLSGRTSGEVVSPTTFHITRLKSTGA